MQDIQEVVIKISFYSLPSQPSNIHFSAIGQSGAKAMAERRGGEEGRRERTFATGQVHN